MKEEKRLCFQALAKSEFSHNYHTCNFLQLCMCDFALHRLTVIITVITAITESECIVGLQKEQLFIPVRFEEEKIRTNLNKSNNAKECDKYL